MAGKSHSKSRRKTPWDEKTELTPTQEFLRTDYKEHYEARHPKLCTTGEAEMINSFVPVRFPYCGSEIFNKRGLTANGITVHVVRHSYQLPTLFLIDAKYQSANGWSIA